MSDLSPNDYNNTDTFLIEEEEEKIPDACDGSETDFLLPMKLRVLLSIVPEHEMQRITQCEDGKLDESKVEIQVMSRKEVQYMSIPEFAGMGSPLRNFTAGNTQKISPSKFATPLKTDRRRSLPSPNLKKESPPMSSRKTKPKLNRFKFDYVWDSEFGLADCFNTVKNQACKQLCDGYGSCLMMRVVNDKLRKACFFSNFGVLAMIADELARKVPNEDDVFGEAYHFAFWRIKHDKVYDGLSPDCVKLETQENFGSGLSPINASSYKIESNDEFCDLLATLYSQMDSRQSYHNIFVFSYGQFSTSSPSICLCDLVTSSNLTKEESWANSSLLFLQRCIAELTLNRHVPYRDCFTTYVLQRNFQDLNQLTVLAILPQKVDSTEAYPCLTFSEALYATAAHGALFDEEEDMTIAQKLDNDYLSATMELERLKHKKYEQDKHMDRYFSGELYPKYQIINDMIQDCYSYLAKVIEEFLSLNVELAHTESDNLYSGTDNDEEDYFKRQSIKFQQLMSKETLQVRMELNQCCKKLLVSKDVSPSSKVWDFEKLKAATKRIDGRMEEFVDAIKIEKALDYILLRHPRERFDFQQLQLFCRQAHSLSHETLMDLMIRE